MYVKSTRKPQRFPPGYNGVLSESHDIIDNPHKHFTVRKNTFCPTKQEDNCDDKIDFLNNDLLLLGLLVFLYVGCEHTKENLILMGVVAYLLFYGR